MSKYTFTFVFSSPDSSVDGVETVSVYADDQDEMLELFKAFHAAQRDGMIVSIEKAAMDPVDIDPEAIPAPGFIKYWLT